MSVLADFISSPNARLVRMKLRSISIRAESHLSKSMGNLAEGYGKVSLDMEHCGQRLKYSGHKKGAKSFESAPFSFVVPRNWCIHQPLLHEARNDCTRQPLRRLRVKAPDKDRPGLYITFEVIGDDQQWTTQSLRTAKY